MQVNMETLTEYNLQEEVIETIMREEVRKYNIFEALGLPIKLYYLIGRQTPMSDNNSFLF
jgi:hypothetical protein